MCKIFGRYVGAISPCLQLQRGMKSVLGYQLVAEKNGAHFLYRSMYFQNVDVTAISLILAGLARCGAFGCFDEFNRLQEATLSVLSMIIQPIQMAIQQKSDTVTIFDQKVYYFR